MEADEEDEACFSPTGGAASSSASPAPYVAYTNPGSIGHPDSCAKPCHKWRPEQPNRCKFDQECKFCHMGHDIARTSQAARHAKMKRQHQEGLTELPEEQQALLNSIYSELPAWCRSAMSSLEDKLAEERGYYLSWLCEFLTWVGERAQDLRPVREKLHTRPQRGEKLWRSSGSEVCPAHVMSSCKWLQGILHTTLMQLEAAGRQSQEIELLKELLQDCETLQGAEQKVFWRGQFEEQALRLTKAYVESRAALEPDAEQRAHDLRDQLLAQYDRLPVGFRMPLAEDWRRILQASYSLPDLGKEVDKMVDRFWQEQDNPASYLAERAHAQRNPFVQALHSERGRPARRADQYISVILEKIAQKLGGRGEMSDLDTTDDEISTITGEVDSELDGPHIEGVEDWEEGERAWEKILARWDDSREVGRLKDFVRALSKRPGPNDTEPWGESPAFTKLVMVIDKKLHGEPRAAGSASRSPRGVAQGSKEPREGEG